MDYTIKYKGKTNLDYDMYWDAGTDFELGTGTPNVDQTDVPGVSGTMLDFNNSYKSFEQKFTFYAVHENTTAQQLKSKIDTWLLKNPGYYPLQDSHDPDYIYEAAPNPNSVIKFPAYNKHFSKIDITFLVKPFKHRIDGMQEFDIPKNGILPLSNPEQWSSYPLIHIKGNSGVTITINDKQYQVTSIDEEIFIDSQPEISMAYKDKESVRNRNIVFPDHQFPILESGDNQISISGNYDSATITPRWQALC